MAPEGQTAYVRCTGPSDDCDFGRNFEDSDDRRAINRARMYQNRHTCPNCNRALACGEGSLNMARYDASADVVQPRMSAAGD